MTLLTVCQDVSDVLTVAKPSAIMSSSTETSRQLKACAKEAAQDLYRRHNWVALQTEYTFSAVASQVDYSLPSDFGRLLNETVWDRTNYNDMRGPLSPSQWQAYKSSILGSTPSTWKKYRIRNVSGTVKFSIYPTPEAADSLVFEYVSNQWCQSSGGAGQSDWSADTDVFLLDEYLLRLGIKWRMLERLGLAYDEAKMDYDNEVRKAIARDGGAPTLSLTGGSMQEHLIDGHNVPDTGYGS